MTKNTAAKRQSTAPGITCVRFLLSGLHRANCQRHGHRACNQHYGIDRPERDIESLMGVVEHLRIDDAENGIGGEQAAEE